MGNNCLEKIRLAKEYDLATAFFSEAVKELHRRMGTSPKEEYGRLDRAANEARVKSEQSRLALEQHVAAHDC
jgi:hypothetical protein